MFKTIATAVATASLVVTTSATAFAGPSMGNEMRGYENEHNCVRVTCMVPNMDNETRGYERFESAPKPTKKTTKKVKKVSKKAKKRIVKKTRKVSKKRIVRKFRKH